MLSVTCNKVDVVGIEGQGSCGTVDCCCSRGWPGVRCHEHTDVKVNCKVVFAVTYGTIGCRTSDSIIVVYIDR